MAESEARLTQESEVPGSIPGLPHTFVSPSANSRRAVISYWRKYLHEILVKRLGGLSLPRKSVVGLTDCPDLTIAVYCERKITIQQLQQQPVQNTISRCNFADLEIHFEISVV